MLYPIPSEVWQLYNQKWAEVLFSRGVLSAEDLALVTLPPPLSPQQQATADANDLAEERVKGQIQEMYRRPCPRADDCGHGASLHMRRKVDGQVQDILIRPHCGRSACPFCWRRRVSNALERALAALLKTTQKGEILPRLEPLHAAEISWAEWNALDKHIRRAHGGSCGRLRVRQDGNKLLVIADKPFCGSVPVTPSEAMGLAAAAVARLNVAKHSFRLLGSWYVCRAPRYELMGRYKHLDHREVQKELQSLGTRSQRFCITSAVGVFWRAQSEKIADLLWGFVLETVCPSLSQQEYTERGKSDSDSAHYVDSPLDTPWELELGIRAT